MKKRRPSTNLLLDALTLLVLFLVLIPIIWVFLASIQPNHDIMSGHFQPMHITFVHFAKILARPDFLIAMRNSLVVGLIVAVGTLLLAVPAAYSLSRFRYLGHDMSGYLILGVQMLPGVAVIVPIVIILRTLGLTNTIGALALSSFLGPDRGVDAQGICRRRSGRTEKPPDTVPRASKPCAGSRFHSSDRPVAVGTFALADLASIWR
jgi:ABC-type glycerol-3-phosphate transport system permease component